MCRLLLIILLFFATQLTIGQTSTQRVLICSYEFNSNRELNDWKIEGEGKAQIKNGKLILEPSHFQMLKELMDAGIISKQNNAVEYQPYLIAAMKKKYGADISRYYLRGIDGDGSNAGDGQFLGGSFNFWNTKFPTGTDFSITFDFRCLYPTPLHMIMFSALGTNGKGIFDNTFTPRYGLSSEIMAGKLNNYRLSFFEPDRKTANLRKAPGRKLLFEGEDVVSKDPGKMYHCEIKKIGGTISYLVDGKTIFNYYDSQPLGGGYWGFRLMPCAIGEYDNIKIYEIRQADRQFPH